MKNILSSPAGRVLAAAWHRRGNLRSLGALALVLVAGLGFPTVFVSQMVVPGEPLPPQDHHLDVIVGGTLLVIGAGLWRAIVGSVLEQNLSTAARLVPGHVRSLRRVLLSAWALLVVAMGTLPGLAWGQPLAGTTAAALLLLVVALLSRWPTFAWAWVLMPLAPNLLPWISALWSALGERTALVVPVLAAAILGLLVQGGGTRHASAHAALIDRNRRMRIEQSGSPDASPANGFVCALMARPYAWWLRRQLARPGSPVGARLLLGFGPASHWTSVLSALGIGAACNVVAWLLPPGVGSGAVAGTSAAMLFVIVPPVLQAHSRLWQVRGEQALLVLSPGVPRAGALNRWLGLRLTLGFAFALAGALALSAGMQALAGVVARGGPVLDMRAGTGVLAAALVALAPLLWRRWDRLHAPSLADAFTPLVAAFALAAAFGLLHWLAGAPVAVLAAAGCAVSAARSALPWKRAGAEPAQLPIGRAAR